MVLNRHLCDRMSDHPACRLAQGSAGGSTGHYQLGLRILVMLVGEMNQPTPGRTLTAHRKVRPHWACGLCLALPVLQAVKKAHHCTALLCPNTMCCLADVEASTNVMYIAQGSGVVRAVSRNPARAPAHVFCKVIPVPYRQQSASAMRGCSRCSSWRWRRCGSSRRPGSRQTPSCRTRCRTGFCTLSFAAVCNSIFLWCFMPQAETAAAIGLRMRSSAPVATSAESFKT